MVFTTAKKLLAIGLLSASLLSTAQSEDYGQHPLALELITEMRDEYGFTEEHLQQVFTQAKRQQSILDAISKPAERVKPWKEYRPIFLTQQRIDKGVQFWAENDAALARAEKEYGVPA